LIALQAELLELKADPTNRAVGRIIEAQIAKGSGSSCSVIVLDGTLKVGDWVACGTTFGKIRAIRDEFGEMRKSIGPSGAAVVEGLKDMPEAGDSLTVLDS